MKKSRAIGSHVDAAALGSTAVWNSARAKDSPRQATRPTYTSPTTSSYTYPATSNRHPRTDSHRPPPPFEPTMSSMSTSTTMTGTSTRTLTRSDSISTTMDAPTTTAPAPLLSDANLRARGKGQYTCPQGVNCRKGGVDPHGNLTLFERNSTFR